MVIARYHFVCFLLSSRSRHTSWPRDWGSDVCSSDLSHLGGLMLLGVGGAAFADEVGGDDVDLDVTIEERQDPGALSLSVAGDSETLTEVEDAAADHREFTGVLQIGRAHV